MAQIIRLTKAGSGKAKPAAPQAPAAQITYGRQGYLRTRRGQTVPAAIATERGRVTAAILGLRDVVATIESAAPHLQPRLLRDFRIKLQYLTVKTEAEIMASLKFKNR